MTIAEESEIHRTPFDTSLNPADKNVVGEFIERLHLYLAKEVEIRH